MRTRSGKARDDGNVPLEETSDKSTSGADLMSPSISTNSVEELATRTGDGPAGNVDAILSDAAKSGPKLESNVENGTNLNVGVMPAHSESDGKTVTTTGGNTSTNVTAIPSQVVTECGELPVPSAGNRTTMEANVTPSQAGAESGQTPVSSTDDRITTTTDVIHSHGAAESSQIPVSSTDVGTATNTDMIPSQAAAESGLIPVSNVDDGTTTKTDVISPQAAAESGLIPVSKADNGKTMITDVIPSQAAVESDEIPLSNNTNAGASMKVIPEGASEEHPKLDQIVKSIGEGSSLTQSDVPHGKYVTQMSPSEKVAMRRFIAEKTREFRITGKKFCEERKLPFPNRQAFHKIIFGLYSTQKLDEHNLELKLMHKAQLIQDSLKKGDGGPALEGGEDGNVISSQAVAESGLIPVSSTDNGTPTNTDIISSQAAADEIPLSNNTNAGASTKVIPEGASDDHSKLDQIVESIGEGSSLTQSDVPHGKYISQMSPDERVAMRKLIAEKTREFRITGKKFCEERKLPFPNRQAFHKLIFDLYNTQKLDEHNLELKLMHKAQLMRDSSKKGDGRSALEGGEDENVDLDKPTSKIGEFRDMAKTYCESKEIPFPTRRNFARIFRDLKSKKTLDEEHLKIALDENALKEKEKPTPEMTEDERTAFFKEFDALKAKMNHVAIQHCHTIKAPFPKRDYHRISRDLFEAGKLNEDNIKLAIEKNFEQQCKNGPSLTQDQLNTILEHYCKDKGIRNPTKRIKDEMMNKIPQKLLSLKHYWRLMHDAGKTNLFWDVNLNPDAANYSSSPLSEARTSRRKRGKRGRKHSTSRGGLEAVPQVADSTVPPERTQKRGLKQTVGNGDLREVLTSKKRREAPSRGGSEGVDEEPIHELLAQIAEKTRLLEGLRAQNYNYSLGSGNGRPSRGHDFGHSYHADRRSDWRSQDDVRFNPSMRNDRLRQNWDDGDSRSGEPFMKYFRYDNRPFGESLDEVNQPIDWAADYENVAGPSNPGTSSRRSWGRASPPVSHGQLTSRDQEDQPFIELGKICKVAIVDEAYPRRHINAQEANLIREALFNRIGSSGVGVGPRFSNTYEEQGAVVFDCEDQTTVAWIWTNAPVLKPWRDARLKPISWGRCSKEISIEIPKMLESHHSEAICERLDKQNPGLSTELWNLKFADSTSRGLTLGFEIDDESMECLKSLNLQPFLGFSRVNVQVIRE